jgi:hypothetical protein
MATVVAETPSTALPKAEAVAEAEVDAKQNGGPSTKGATTTTNPNNATQSEEEGVEVVLGVQGPDQVVDSVSPPRHTPDQNVFRGAHYESSRSHHSGAGRAHYPPRGPPPPPYGVQASGSYGYGGRPDYPPPTRPYAVPPYNPSGSFEESAYPHNRTPSHYSPNVQYPPPGGRYPGEDVNVISPNHKSGDPKYRSTTGSQRRSAPPNYYQYPPASPVSRRVQTASPPRLRNFAVRKTIDGPYSKAQRSSDSHGAEEAGGSWNPFPAPSRTASRAERPQPPLVTESSFDSDHFSRSHYSAHPSHPPTPGSGAPNHDPTQQFYGPGGSWASFDSAGAHPLPPPHYDDYSRHQHHAPPPRTPSSHYPEPPYSPYSHHSSPSTGYHSHYSPGGAYYPPPEHYSSYHGYGPPQSYEDDERGLLKDYHPDRDSENIKSGDGKKGKPLANKSATGIVLPAAAHEVDFDVTDPPAEPVCPPSSEPLVESLADVNTYDVLCGRGGGTNSQIGNKRFRKLVQDFQPTYLLARRKEKPLLARTIVLIIRKRGGRFLRKDEETGMLYEVGDAKAEAKTSQALREGLDVRATKSAASPLSDKKKKKKKPGASGANAAVPASCEDNEEDAIMEEPAESGTAKSDLGEAKLEIQSPERTPERPAATNLKATTPSPMKEEPEPESPPSLPKLADEEVKSGMVHPHSPEAMHFRKRRRMRALACGADKFFPDFCPPRADLARCDDGNNTDESRGGDSIMHSPMRRASSIDDEDMSKVNVPGCTAAAFEIVTGAVTGGFCFGPSK